MLASLACLVNEELPDSAAVQDQKENLANVVHLVSAFLAQLEKMDSLDEKVYQAAKETLA